MKPKFNSNRLLGVTRSKAKMHEYNVAEEYHIEITQNPEILFSLSIGILGDLSAEINRHGLKADSIKELQSELTFSAQFFDTYIQSKLNEELDPYLLLIGSASYYLLDRPGSALVLANRLNSKDWLNIGGGGLEDLLLWILQGNYSFHFEDNEWEYGHYLDSISKEIDNFFSTGEGKDTLVDVVNQLRSSTYESGSARQLLYSDIIGAIIHKKLSNSTWLTLPVYSNIPITSWLPALQKSTFIKELWPSQHLLGSQGVLSGESAVVQMPTSAGKTKASELIIRSAFLSKRASIAVVVAPFRALCHEIRNDLAQAFQGEDIDTEEVSDVTQLDIDFESFTITQRKKVLVLTPEKLFYILQHDKSYATETGLVIFDEGHQFDSGTRGVTYELLLTSLRSLLPDTVQKVLISAVISNAEPIGQWLNNNSNIVSGSGLISTFRTIGLTSWTSTLGQIQFVDSTAPESKEFFVPRVLSSHSLEKRGRERKEREFPEKNNGKDIALHLGLNLCVNGSVAIFCGTKTTAVNLCSRLCDVISRNAPYTSPIYHSNHDEVTKLAFLYNANLGSNAPVSQGAKLGVFTHHGNTPHGIRLAVEYAMSKELALFVICTSTLAQGVNLPLRYLIITSVYQAGERIKVRDFHNLIGRVGRSGMHTEGSILFADSEVYDKKTDFKQGWRWAQVKELLNPLNSEPCVSNILTIFNYLTNDRGEDIIELDALEFFRQYYSDPEQLKPVIIDLARRFATEGATETGIARQLSWRIKLVNAIESFLLTHLESTDDLEIVTVSQNLAEQTLGYFMADAADKKRISELFQVIAENLRDKVKSQEEREICGRTMLGVYSSQLIKEWVHQNIIPVLTCSTVDQVTKIILSLSASFPVSKTLAKLNNQDLVPQIIKLWLVGDSFFDIHSLILKQDVKLRAGTQNRQINIEHVVQICENELAFDGSLLVGALCEYTATIEDERSSDAEAFFRLIQKRLKYGLKSKQSVLIYELGLADRVIAQDLCNSLNLESENKSDIIDELRAKSSSALELIKKYPIYYQNKLSGLIDS